MSTTISTVKRCNIKLQTSTILLNLVDFNSMDAPVIPAVRGNISSLDLVLATDAPAQWGHQFVLIMHERTIYSTHTACLRWPRQHAFK